MRSAGQTRTVAGNISAAGVVTSQAGSFTAVKASTGDYTVYFDRPFLHPPLVSASPASGAAMIVAVAQQTVQSFRVITSSTIGGAAADLAWTFVATGV